VSLQITKILNIFLNPVPQQICVRRLEHNFSTQLGELYCKASASAGQQHNHKKLNVYSKNLFKVATFCLAFPLIFCLRNTQSIPGFSFVSFSVGMRARGKNEISLVRACMHVCLTKVTFLLVQEQRQKMQLWPHKKCSGCAKHIQAN
jgi:hypothetical protein